MQNLKQRNVKLLRIANAQLLEINGTTLLPWIIAGRNLELYPPIIVGVGTLLFSIAAHFIAPYRYVWVNTLGNLFFGTLSLAIYSTIEVGADLSRVPDFTLVMLLAGWFIYLPGVIVFVILDFLILLRLRRLAKIHGTN